MSNVLELVDFSNQILGYQLKREEQEDRQVEYDFSGVYPVSQPQLLEECSYLA